MSTRGMRGVAGRTVGVVALATGLLSASAVAAPGDHIRAGDAVITPSVSAGVEVSSNAFRSDRDPRLAFNFVGELGLALDVTKPKVTFSLDTGWNPRIYFTDSFTKLNNLSNVRFDARLNVAPDAVVGFRFRDKLRTPSIANDQELQLSSLITQIRNEASVDLPIRIGPEFVLEPGFEWDLHNYRIPSSSDPDALGQRSLDVRNTLMPTLDLSWRFFPNTAFVVEAAYQNHIWADNVVSADGVTIDDGTGTRFSFGDFLALPNSQHLKAMTGIRGRITEVLVLNLLVGYGFGIYDPDSVDDNAPAGAAGELATERDCVAGADNPQCYSANVSATDAILALAKVDLDLGHRDKRRFGQLLSLQYRKDFEDSFFTNYVHEHHVKLSLDSLWGQYVRTHLEGGVRFENYEGEYARNDVFPKGDFWLDILPTRYLAIRVGLLYTRRFSTDPTVQFENIQGRTVLSFVY